MGVYSNTPAMESAGASPRIGCSNLGRATADDFCNPRYGVVGRGFFVSDRWLVWLPSPPCPSRGVACGYIGSGEGRLDVLRSGPLLNDLGAARRGVALLASPAATRRKSSIARAGMLLRSAAEHHGDQALGIALSRTQATLARQRIAIGVQDCCRTSACGYRTLEAAPCFGRIISVGIEHTDRAQRLRKPSGPFLNQGIVDLAARSLRFAT